jgi:hypothetical protein
MTESKIINYDTVRKVLSEMACRQRENYDIACDAIEAITGLLDENATLTNKLRLEERKCNVCEESVCASEYIADLTEERDEARRRHCLSCEVVNHGTAHNIALDYYGKAWADKHYPRDNK